MEVFVLGIFITGVIILSCISVSRIANKQTYFKKQLERIRDEDEKRTLTWYVKTLGLKIKLYVGGIVIVLFPAIIFNDQIAALMEYMNPRNAYFALVIFCGVALWLFSYLAKGSQNTLKEKLENDNRPPVLYLRPFQIDDDAIEVAIKQINYATKEAFKTSLIALGEAQWVGPVIAIADPQSSERKEIGFSMEAYENWQAQVLEFMEKCSLIVFRPYDTPGVVWEFEQIIQKGYLQKTIIVLKGSSNLMPEYLKKYQTFKAEILKKEVLILGEYDPTHPMIYFDRDNAGRETDDYFDIPIFRKVFCQQFIMRGKGWFKV